MYNAKIESSSSARGISFRCLFYAHVGTFVLDMALFYILIEIGDSQLFTRVFDDVAYAGWIISIVIGPSMLILFAGQFRLMFWFWDLSDNPVYAFDEMLASSGLFRLVWRSSLVAILVSLWGVAQVYPVNITWLSAAVACILIYAVATWPDYTNIMRRI